MFLLFWQKALENGSLGRNVCDSHKEPAVGTNLPLVGMNGRQPKSRFAVNPKPQLFLRESEITKLPRYGTAVYVREVERCTKYIYALNEPVVSTHN